MTSAYFDWHVSHHQGTCTPQAGHIKGTLVPDLTGGTYDLTFFVDDTQCGAKQLVSNGGEEVNCDADHDCTPGPQNVTIVITRTDDDSSRTQGPDPVCL